MTDDYTVLARTLRANTSLDHIILLSPEQLTRDFMLVPVPDALAAMFVARLREPLVVEYTDGTDDGAVWQAHRVETVTEAALDLLRIEFPKLIADLRSAGASASESLGGLLLDGEETVIVLVDANREIIPQLLAIRRAPAEFGESYPLFERDELTVTGKTCQVYLSASETWR